MTQSIFNKKLNRKRKAFTENAGLAKTSTEGAQNNVSEKILLKSAKVLKNFKMKVFVDTLPTSNDVRDLPKPTVQNWNLKLPSVENHQNKLLKSMEEQVSNNYLS